MMMMMALCCFRECESFAEQQQRPDKKSPTSTILGSSGASGFVPCWLTMMALARFRSLLALELLAGSIDFSVCRLLAHSLGWVFVRQGRSESAGSGPPSSEPAPAKACM